MEKRANMLICKNKKEEQYGHYQRNRQPGKCHFDNFAVADHASKASAQYLLRVKGSARGSKVYASI